MRTATCKKCGRPIELTQSDSREDPPHWVHSTGFDGEKHHVADAEKGTAKGR